MSKGLVIKTNYDCNVPLTHVYADLGIQPSPYIVLKPVRDGVLIITRSPRVMRLLSTRISGERIIYFRTLEEFYHRIMDNLNGCSRVEVWNTSPIIMHLDLLLKIFKNLGLVENMKVRFEGDRIAELHVLIRPGKGSLRRIVLMVIYGLGFFRELGYGAVNARCVD